MALFTKRQVALTAIPKMTHAGLRNSSPINSPYHHGSQESVIDYVIPEYSITESNLVVCFSGKKDPALPELWGEIDLG